VVYLLFDPEDRSTTFLYNVDVLPDCMELHTIEMVHTLSANFFPFFPHDFYLKKCTASIFRAAE
jgi:hypothetical protein